jgi:5'-nucleotidase / UDP-sugar diphosphatase
VSIKIGEKTLDDARAYKVATNDYLAAGKDGYEAFLRATPLVAGDAAPLLSAVVIEAIGKSGSIAPVEDGRIELR